MENNLREPDFNIDRDIIMVSNKGTSMQDGTKGLSLRANVILLSYNRPRMIQEAIESVITQSYKNLLLFIADDGSDFSFAPILDKYKDDRILIYRSPKINVKERIKKSRVAENINNIIKDIPEDDVIYYLCDDDIMAPDWISRSIAALQHAPLYHIVQGDCWSFNDGQDWRTSSIRGTPLPYEDNTPRLWWATGSFCHKAICWHKENIRWHDNIHGHSQDTIFITDMWEKHSQYLIIDKPSFYRREHKNMLSSRLGRKDDYGKYLPGFVPPPIDEKMVEGWME